MTNTIASPRSVAYYIKRRDGTLLFTVVHNTPDRAYLSATYHVKHLYLKAGVQQPLFDGDPLFYAEGV